MGNERKEKNERKAIRIERRSSLNMFLYKKEYATFEKNRQGWFKIIFMDKCQIDRQTDSLNVKTSLTNSL